MSDSSTCPDLLLWNHLIMVISLSICRETLLCGFYFLPIILDGKVGRCQATWRQIGSSCDLVQQHQQCRHGHHPVSLILENLLKWNIKGGTKMLDNSAFTKKFADNYELHFWPIHSTRKYFLSAGISHVYFSSIVELILRLSWCLLLLPTTWHVGITYMHNL